MDLACCPVEEFGLLFLFQIPDLLAQCRLSYVEFLCRSAEMKFFCDCNNIPQQSELNTRIHRPTLQGPVFEWVCRTTYGDPHFDQDENVFSRLSGVKS